MGECQGGMSPRGARGLTDSRVQWFVNRLDYVFLLHSSLQECAVFDAGACIHCAADDFSIGNIGSI